MLPYTTGSFATALRAAKSARRLRRARRSLVGRIYAKSSKNPRRSRLRTIRRLLAAAGRPFLPISPEAMKDLGAALHAGGHRSTSNYFGDWKKVHVEADYPWTDRLAALRKDLLRASARGRGPPKRAETFGAEQMPQKTSDAEHPVTRGGPRWPRLMLAIGVCWMLRGAEMADLLGDQASLAAERREATLHLRATKMDTAGAGCLRTLKCICGTGLLGPCPYCALVALIAARARADLGPKDPLFPTAGGRAAEAKSVVRSLRHLLKIAVTEHSLRREGAQLLARRGVHLFLIQFLGRWGGPTVAIYAAEALRGQLAQAAASSAGGGVGGPNGPSREELRKTLQELVDEAIARRTADSSESAVGDPGPMHAILTAASAPPGAPGLPPPRQVRGLKGGREVGETHDVAIADPALPEDAWVTRCGWRFGRTAHAVFFDREATCARCMARRTVDIRKGICA